MLSTMLALLYMVPYLTAAQSSVDSWQVAFWEGLNCASSEVQVDNGPNPPEQQKICNPIPDIGVSETFNFAVPAGDFEFILGLHQDPDCGDDGGMYSGTAGTPTCQEIGEGPIAYSVQTLSTGSSRKRDSEVTTIQSRQKEESGLTTRAQYFEPNFILATGIGSATFFYFAAQQCPAYATDPNSAACGIAATSGVILLLLTAFSLQGFYRHGKRDLSDVFMFLNDEILDGHSVSVFSMDPWRDSDGEYWAQSALSILEHDSGKVINGTYAFHADSGRHQVSHPVDIIDKKTMKRDTGALANFGWINGNQQAFGDANIMANANQTAGDLGDALWNYGHSQNLQQFCATMVLGPDPPQRLLTGNFALQGSTSTFYNQAQDCASISGK